MQKIRFHTGLCQNAEEELVLTDYASTPATGQDAEEAWNWSWEAVAYTDCPVETAAVNA